MADDRPMDFIDTEAEPDLVTLIDDEGNEFDMEVISVFEHEDKKYALLAEVLDEEMAALQGDALDEEDESLYIFEIIEDENGVEYAAIEDDDLLETLSGIVEQMALFDDED